jgi:mono/diheme cytochrome c family protein
MRLALAAIFAALIPALFTVAIAQNPPRIWAGSYTTAQAERGRTVVEAHCGECHQDDLSGGEGPALVGPTFMLKWELNSVERLFHKIRDTMPEAGSSDVSDVQKLDAVAYILQQNGFPAGTTELSEASALAELRIVPRDGPSPPRSGALVVAVGCLREAKPNAWTLAGSTDPQVTTREPMTAADKEALSAAPAGSQTVELLSVYPRPAALIDNTVLVKGLFVKTATAVRINVTSMELMHLHCGQ